MDSLCADNIRETLTANFLMSERCIARKCNINYQDYNYNLKYNYVQKYIYFTLWEVNISFLVFLLNMQHRMHNMC